MVSLIHHIRSALAKDTDHNYSLARAYLDYANHIFAIISDLEINRLQHQILWHGYVCVIKAHSLILLSQLHLLLIGFKIRGLSVL